jgi:hypothetical protein
VLFALQNPRGCTTTNLRCSLFKNEEALFALQRALLMCRRINCISPFTLFVCNSKDAFFTLFRVHSSFFGCECLVINCISLITLFFLLQRRLLFVLSLNVSFSGHECFVG